jgi:predicted nucleic acid-binding protein
MSAERATYLDASALVKLAIHEPESAGLHRYLSRRRPLLSSALSRTEVTRALVPLGARATMRGYELLARIDLLRVSDRVLNAAGTLDPMDLRSLDAIHLSTALQLGSDLARIVTYDRRMSQAASMLGMTVVSPG